MMIWVAAGCALAGMAAGKQPAEREMLSAAIDFGVAPARPCTGSSALLPVSECQAWQDIYDDMGGAGWISCSDARADPCACSREVGVGAQCMAGHITGLFLDQNNLTGAIPASISGLARLTELSAYQNNITGLLPTALCSLERLELLSLESNQLSGGIPPCLGELAKLQVIDLELNRLSGTIPANITSMTSLQRLDLLNNRLTGLLPALPWKQYTLGCWLGGNLFECPLPTGAKTECVGDPRDGGNPPACH